MKDPMSPSELLGNEAVVDKLYMSTAIALLRSYANIPIDQLNNIQCLDAVRDKSYQTVAAKFRELLANIPPNKLAHYVSEDLSNSMHNSMGKTIKTSLLMAVLTSNPSEFLLKAADDMEKELI